MESKNNTHQEIISLCRKAEQTRSIQNNIKDRIVLTNKIFLLYVGIGSAISSMFIFSSLNPVQTFYLGLFSASVFIASIVPAILNFDLKILERSIAVKSWGSWIREAKAFCGEDISKIDESTVVAKGKELLNSYKRIMDDTPLISDTDFLKYKAKHLQKVVISKYLDEKPFKTIKEIKKELSK
jgi:hypothetical protein